MTTYAALLLDTDGTELARTDDLSNYREALNQARDYAEDMEYKDSAPGKVQIVVERNGQIVEIKYEKNHVVRDREIMGAAGIEPYASQARFAEAVRRKCDTFGSAFYLAGGFVHVHLSGAYTTHEVRALMREMEAVQAAVGYNKDIEAPRASGLL